MNCPSRTDNTDGRDGWNQSPNLLSGTTREDFNGMANARMLRRIESSDPELVISNTEAPDAQRPRKNSTATIMMARTLTSQSLRAGHVNNEAHNGDDSNGNPNGSFWAPNFLTRVKDVVVKFGKFVGPGFMVRNPRLMAIRFAEINQLLTVHRYL
jgi:metal iron transporter